LWAEGVVVHRGRRTATAEAKLVDAKGKVFAHATTTCLIL
jgi:acyl-coenzyme A thioesterase PaaI-like protein